MLLAECGQSVKLLTLGGRPRLRFGGCSPSASGTAGVAGAAGFFRGRPGPRLTGAMIGGGEVGGVSVGWLDRPDQLDVPGVDVPGSGASSSCAASETGSGSALRFLLVVDAVDAGGTAEDMTCFGGE